MELTVKKFSALLLCCLMIITCSLAGCATFSINPVKYYNEIVASVGDTKITRFDLLSAYNSYGYSYYVSQEGQSEEEAINSTLDLLIDRELLYQYALDHDDIYRPTPYQVNSAIQTIFDSVDEQVSEYIDEAKGILNIPIADAEDSAEEEEETAYLYDDYTYSKRAEVKSETTYYTDETKTTVSSTPTAYFDTTYYIDYITETEPTVYDELIASTYLNDFTQNGTIEAIIASYLSHLRATLNNEETENQQPIYNKVISLLSKDLMEYEYYLRDENGKEYSTNTNDLLYRYFERNFESQIESLYLENIRTYYLENENLSIDALIEEFQYLVNVNYNQYRNHEENYKEAMKDIGSNGDTILYHPTTSDGTQFGYFVHTLLSFSEDQQSMITALESNKNSFSDEQAYNNAYNAIVNQTVITVRDAETGMLTDETKTLSQVMDEYSEILKISDYNDRLYAFIQFMFKYTGDTATLSSGMPYVVGTNGYSAMEEAFTDEAVRLMTEGNVGDMTSDSTENMCVTSYGVHLLFYVNPVNAYDVLYSDVESVYIQNTNRDDNGKNNLYYKIINPLTNETYFDMLFDAVYPASDDEENYSSNTGYTDYENNLVSIAENTYKVTKYTSKISATKQSI